LSPEGLEGLADPQPGTVGAVENGTGAVPDQMALERLAATLGLTPEGLPIGRHRRNRDDVGPS